VDPVAGLRWLKESAVGGYYLAQANLAERYESGSAVDRDKAMAVTWYYHASRGGDPKSGAAFRRLSKTLASSESSRLDHAHRECELAIKTRVVMEKLPKPHQAVDLVEAFVAACVSREFAMVNFFCEFLGYKKGISRMHRDRRDEMLIAAAWKGSGSHFRLAEWEDVVSSSLADEDSQFFVELGRILSKPELLGHSYDKLRYLLANWWVDTSLDHAPLCCFTDGALAKLVGLKLGGGSVSEARVKKTQQRMGLVRLPKRLRLLRTFGDTNSGTGGRPSSAALDEKRSLSERERNVRQLLQLVQGILYPHSDVHHPMR
jgi:hypothetical protein